MRAVRCPLTLLSAELIRKVVGPVGSGLELDSNYYLERVLLPPLSRVLNLLGADVEQWFKTMPRPKLVTAPPFGDPAIQKAAAKKRKKQVSKLTDHYRSDLCFLCGIYTDKGARFSAEAAPTCR